MKAKFINGIKLFSRTKDLRNVRFGKLLVLDFIGYKGSEKKTRAHWKCICDCGNIVEQDSNNLLSNHTKSCGCLTLREDGMAAENSLFIRYQYSANKRGIPFNITFEEFCSIIKRPCHFCKSPPSNAQPKRYRGTGPYTGIDRQDSDRGYYLDNIVPCCKICNRAKSDMSLEDFIEWLKRVAKEFST